MLVSDRLSEAERAQLGAPRRLLKPLSLDQAKYLRFHRDRWGFPVTCGDGLPAATPARMFGSGFGDACDDRFPRLA